MGAIGSLIGCVSSSGARVDHHASPKSKKAFGLERTTSGHAER
jgi:hypothetical protein